MDEFELIEQLVEKANELYGSGVGAPNDAAVTLFTRSAALSALTQTSLLRMILMELQKTNVNLKHMSGKL